MDGVSVREDLSWLPVSCFLEGARYAMIKVAHILFYFQNVNGCFALGNVKFR